METSKTIVYCHGCDVPATLYCRKSHTRGLVYWCWQCDQLNEACKRTGQNFEIVGFIDRSTLQVLAALKAFQKDFAVLMKAKLQLNANLFFYEHKQQ